MAYAAHKGLSAASADLLWAVVRRMDSVERRWRYDELKQEIGGGS